MSKNNKHDSVIGEGSVFTGKFYVDGDLKIEGSFEGDIRTDESLIVTNTGRVKTSKVSAKRIVLKGILIGDVYAKEEVNLESRGKMLGNIVTPNLVVSPGVVYRGNIDIIGDSKKDTKQFIEDIYNAETKKAKSTSQEK